MALSVTPRALTVGELTARIREVLEGAFRQLWVVGELTSVKTHASGHVYLTLSDADARLDAVIWRTTFAGIRHKPQLGTRVLVLGRLSVYPPRGGYQLVVERLEPAGAGAQEAALQALRARFAAEGLFDPARKRPLPRLPRKVGLVTSPSGAARRDVESVLHRRSPQIPIVLYPAAVQGESAPLDLARGIRALGRSPGVDVIVLARGGGSAEDLSAFNTELVVRAIAACPVPVVSAVGHETDFTLVDLVADLRAATPSVAAEAVVPIRDDLRMLVDGLSERATAAVGRRLAGERGRLGAHAGRLSRALRFDDRRLVLHRLRGRLDGAFARRLHTQRCLLQQLREGLGHHHPVAALVRARTAFDVVAERLQRSMPGRVAVARADLRMCAARLENLSPLRVLERGYSITFAPRGVLTTVQDVEPGDALVTRLHDGLISSTVNARSTRPLTEPKE